MTRGGGEVGISSIELASIPSEGMNTFPDLFMLQKPR